MEVITFISAGLCILWLISVVGLGINMHRLFKSEEPIDILRYENNCNFYQTLMWMALIANWIIWVIKTKW